MSRLRDLFQEQLKLNIHINSEFKKIVESGDIELKRKWLNNTCIAMQCEIAECLESSGYKWWKKLPEWTEENVHNLKIELVDILHFLVMGMQVLGMDDDEMWDLYLKKKELNHKRQNEGYKQGTYKKIDEKGKEDNHYLMKTNPTEAEMLVKAKHPKAFLESGGCDGPLDSVMIPFKGGYLCLGSGCTSDEAWKEAAKNLK